MDETNQLRFGFTCSKEFQELYNNTNIEKLKRLGIDRGSLDIGTAAFRYFTDGFTIDDNANAVSFGAGNYEAETIKPWHRMDSIYMLHKKLHDADLDANRILNRAFDGEIYIHDSHSLMDRLYCVGISMGLMHLEGLPFSDLKSKPAKHSSTFIGQAGELVFALSQMFIGATAESDLLLHYAAFLENEPNKTDEEIIQDFQRYIWIVNQKLRSSSQSPFTNISIFDKYLLETLIEDASLDVDLERVQYIQNLWMEYFGKGNDGLPFRFPVTSINLQTENDVIKDRETLENSCEFGYRLACFNYYAGDDKKFTSCCRLTTDIDELRNKFVDTWGSGLNLGSMRVCSLNLPYIALLSVVNETDVDEALLSILDDVYQILKIQRQTISKRINQNFIPVFKPLNWLNEKMFFSTIGILGLWEAGQILANSNDIKDTIPIMDNLITLTERFTKEHSTSDFLLNLEFVPGETAAYKLADAINKKFRRSDFQLLSNQIVPLDTPMGLPERMKITGQLEKKFSGGALVHANFNEHVDEVNIFRKVIESSVKVGVNHLAINYIFSICENYHGFRGETCPVCKKPKVDDVSRTVGYYTPVSKWNISRRSENRQWY